MAQKKSFLKSVQVSNFTNLQEIFCSPARKLGKDTYCYWQYIRTDVIAQKNDPAVVTNFILWLICKVVCGGNGK